MNSIRRALAGVAVGVVGAASLALGAAAPASLAGAATPTSCVGPGAVSNVTYSVAGQALTTQNDSRGLGQQTINGVSAGDELTVTFTANCATTLGLAAYAASSPAVAQGEQNPEGENAFFLSQKLVDNQSVTLTKGQTASMTVAVPADGVFDVSSCPNPKNIEPETKGKGANTTGVYDSTCDGRASQNGNSTKDNSSKPCQGCVGNADNKNPKGQLPNARNDGNNGYECDGNNGIAKGNPAHSGCQIEQWFQVDFFTGTALTTVGKDLTTGATSYYGSRLIAAARGNL